MIKLSATKDSSPLRVWSCSPEMAHSIEHRLTKPRTPRTNGMVERFNGRIADVLKKHRFNSALDMEQTLMRYVALYNHQLPQSALKNKTPIEASIENDSKTIEESGNKPAKPNKIRNSKR